MAETFNDKKHVRGRRLAYNAGIQAWYKRELKKLVRRMAKEVSNEVLRLFRSNLAKDYREQQKQIATMDASLASQARILMNKLKDKYTALFDDKAPFLAKELVSRSEKQSRNSLKDSFEGLINEYTLSPNYLPAGVKEVAKSTIAENVSLITTIPEEYFKNITGAVMRSITTGYGVSELKNYLSKFYGQSSRKAKNVALDQTRKAYNNINKQRMMAAGLNSFEWIHSGGGLKPRQEHIELSGKIFSFDDLPVIVPDTGEKGIPGQAINCGCTMRPVYVFPEGEQ